MKKLKVLFVFLGIITLFAFAVTQQTIEPPIVDSELVLEADPEPIIYQASILGDVDGDSAITWLFGLLASVFAGAFGFIKKKISKIAKLFKESYEAINAIDKALEDDNLSKTELKNIKKEMKDVIAAFKDLISKKPKDNV